MPYYFPQAVAVWLVALFVIEWGRWRELVFYGILGGYLCLLQDHVGGMSGLWRYHDIGLFNSHAKISMLISLSAAPLFAMYFVQGLKPGGGVPVGRILGVVAVAMLPEVVGLYTGNITHGHWWNAWTSLAAHLLLWLGIWLVYKGYTAQGSRSAG